MRVPMFARQIEQWALMTLLSYPVGMQVDRWLHAEFPQLRADQTIGMAQVQAENLRLLSLSLLASEYEEIPYAEVGATLQVPQGEVEAWVVEAITAGLVEARMDQQQEVVMVTRATHRHCARGDWAKLQEKLHSWRHNVEGLLATLRARSAAGARGAPSN